MYKVLLVDDEPLVLAGIKIMVDWPRLGCELVGNARNGSQALEAIGRLRPDIVIADINMPVLDGIELLRDAATRWPDVVFIMLTNLQEFELARDSLRYGASDYLIKSQLEADMLNTSLEKAKAECDKRRSLARADMAESYLNNGSATLLREAVMHFISFPTVPKESTGLLQREGVLDNYTLAEIQFLYPGQEDDETPNSHKNVFLWQRELVEELSRNCFARYITTDLDIPQRSIFLVVWEEKESALAASMENFTRKLMAASSNITRVQPCLLVTETLHGKNSLPICRRQLFALRDCFYLCGETVLHHSTMPKYQYRPLHLTGLADSLRIELERRSPSGCMALFDKAITTIRDTAHEKSQALWLCTGLHTAVADTVKDWPLAQASGGFGDMPFARFRHLATREDVLRFLQNLKNEVATLLQPVWGKSSDIVEKAIQYVYDNIEKKIMLANVASHVCISPGYLSAQFKKQYGENFVDFINRTKIQRACELIAQNEYRISQIGYMLGYENAYYFTRVFKRYQNMTPSEYSEKLKREKQNAN